MRRSLLFAALLTVTLVAKESRASNKPTLVSTKTQKEIGLQNNVDKKISTGENKNYPTSVSSQKYQLQQILFESNSSQIKIKIQTSGGVHASTIEAMKNPGRLVIEIPDITNGINLNIHEFTDHLSIPRIRLAEHAEKIRLIIDTVLSEFPRYTAQKNDHEIVLQLEKTPEIIAEAKAKVALFEALRKDDRESLLKTGSEDEGGILFATKEARSLSGKIKGSTESAPLQVNQKSSYDNRVVLLLDDRKEYKIFLEDTQTPIHIRKIRPAYEVKGLQARLNQLGYSTGLEDGSIGPLTRAALKQFQKDQGLPVTGTTNRATQRELRKRFGY